MKYNLRYDEAWPRLFADTLIALEERGCEMELLNAWREVAKGRVKPPQPAAQQALVEMREIQDFDIGYSLEEQVDAAVDRIMALL